MMKQVLFVSLFFSFSFGQYYSAADAFENIRAKYSTLNDASASFVQSVQLKHSQSVRKLSGSAKIKKGNKYVIENGVQTIVTDGTTLWLYTPANKQVMVDQFKASRQSLTPEKFLLGLPKDFTAVQLRKQEEWHVLSLQPTAGNKGGSFIVALDVWCKPESWIIEKIEYRDRNGTITTLVLSDLKFNQGIVDNEFQFKITDEMKVIDLKEVR